MGTLRSVISLAYSEDETHMSDLRTVGRDCPCGVRDRWLPGLPPLARLPVDTPDPSSVGWQLLHASPWAGTGTA